MLSRQYSHFVTGMFAMFLTGTMILVPVLVNVVVTHNSYSEWNIAFIVTAVILVGFKTQFLAGMYKMICVKNFFFSNCPSIYFLNPSVAYTGAPCIRQRFLSSLIFARFVLGTVFQKLHISTETLAIPLNFLLIWICRDIGN